MWAVRLQTLPRNSNIAFVSFVRVNRTSHSKSGLFRWSAVVRGAVDTGRRRNNKRRGLEEEKHEQI